MIKSFSEYYVFMIDGATYNEYQNFSEISLRLNKKVYKNSK